jgi:peptidyl-prolyl cis-trans isomerase B (cyclophilin B)
MDVLNANAALPTVKDNSASPFFASRRPSGTREPLVAEQAFGKPFAKVTVAKCGRRQARDAAGGRRRDRRASGVVT